MTLYHQRQRRRQPPSQPPQPPPSQIQRLRRRHAEPEGPSPTTTTTTTTTTTISTIHRQMICCGSRGRRTDGGAAPKGGGGHAQGILSPGGQLLVQPSSRLRRAREAALSAGRFLGPASGHSLADEVLELVQDVPKAVVLWGGVGAWGRDGHGCKGGPRGGCGGGCCRCYPCLECAGLAEHPAVHQLQLAVDRGRTSVHHLSTL